MDRLLGILPALGIAAYMTGLEVSGHDLSFMRPLCLGLALLLLPALVLGLRRGVLPDVSLGLAAYPLLAGLLWWLAPGWAIAASSSAAAWLYLWLAAVAGLPPLWGRAPFTTFFARRSTPPAVWETDIFKAINRHLTWAWTAIFLASAGLAALPRVWPALAGLGGLLLCTVALPMALMLGLGVWLNRWYPEHYQRRLGLTPVVSAPAEPPAEPAAAPANPPAAPAKEEKMSGNPLVVALNASPHAGMGNTGQMIEMLRPTLAQEGLDLEVLELHGKEIEYCVGCAFCMERGACWIDDDHPGMVKRLLAADAIVLGSPVYFHHVTGQMKTFLDRSLAFGHKPRGTWKPGLAISVTARVGETQVAEYLSGMLKVYGAYSVGALTALATAPGEFMGKEDVEARAADLARDLARAVKEKRRYPVTGNDYVYWLFMRELVAANKDGVMRDDFAHWQKHGLYDSFEDYAGRKTHRLSLGDATRQAWIQNMIAERKARKRRAADSAPASPAAQSPAPPAAAGPHAAKTCRELLQIMPLGFHPEAAGDLRAIYQFEVREGEEFTAHLSIAEGKCVFVEGPAAKPDVVIKTPAQVWLDISQGRLNGQTAFMSGKYQVEGNLMLLMRLSQLFA